MTGTGSPCSFKKKDPFNNANDYLEIHAGDTWKGEFIPVPESVARGTILGVPAP